MLMVFNQKKKKTEKKYCKKNPELEARISLFSANANFTSINLWLRVIKNTSSLCFED